MKFTVGTADTSIGSSQYSYFRQPIEGFNVADMDWGLSTAKSATLSFWVKSNLTGLFSGNLASTGHDRCSAFTYTINAANTWEYKTVTITGDTTGTWNKTNSVGAYLHFALAVGSTYVQSATNTFQAGTFLGYTGTTNLFATSGNTFYITGVQLEKGTTASSFEFRSIQKELILCQRYYEQSNPNTAAASLYTLDSGTYLAGWNYSGTSGVSGSTPFKVIKRASPTMVTYTTAQGSSATANRMSHYQGSWTNYGSSIPMVDVSCFAVAYSGGSTGSSLTQYNWTASAEL
jgi:hypothetical protein